MITSDFINSDLGFVLNAMGFPVSNAALWHEELGANAPSEEAILAKWEEIKAQREASQSAQSAYDAALSQGFTIPNTEIVMSVSPKSKSTMDEYANHLDRKLQAGIIDGGTLIPVIDKDDVPHMIHYHDFIDMIIPFGDRCQEVWFLGLAAGKV